MKLLPNFLLLLLTALLIAACDIEYTPTLYDRPDSYKLNYAIAHGETELVKRIIERGFPINAPFPDDEYENRPLNTAAYYGHREIVEYLLSKGADINALNKSNARTALLTAVWKNRNDVAKYLVLAGADASVTTAAGMTMIEFARRCRNDEFADWFENRPVGATHQ
jgi:ankyrin repeat protein